MYETRKGSALDNALWPLRYANKNPAPIDAQPIGVEGAKKMLREFDEAFPAVRALIDLDSERRRNTNPQLQQIPRSK